MASQFLARPFAALRPTAASAADVIAPPYDVVSTDEARALAVNRPLSFLHISRPEIDLPPGSSAYSDAAYERGAENLARLRDGGVLVRERSFYVYRMVMNGRAQTGVAFAASVAAYQANRIRRHELTRPDASSSRSSNPSWLAAIRSTNNRTAGNHSPSAASRRSEAGGGLEWLQAEDVLSLDAERFTTGCENVHASRTRRDRDHQTRNGVDHVLAIVQTSITLE